MKSRLQKADKLRKKHPQFIYEKFDFKLTKNNLKMSFKFKIEPNIYFFPKITIKNIDRSKINSLDDKVLKNLIFHLGLIEIPSYWKSTCSKEIIIKAGYLNKEQTNWWKNLILNGQGEFFFENNIEFTKNDFIQIKSLKTKSNKLSVFKQELKKEKVLIPIGGGKDSIITLKILKGGRKETNCLILNPKKILSTLKIAKKMGYPKPIIIEREIDENLLDLNKKGYLNGHTPFSAYLAFLSTFCATFFGYKMIALSNESSANEENIMFLGKKINHQYSKSYNFEKEFNKYQNKYLTKNIFYFSFLRPLHEIQIGKIFSKYPNYFSIFKSCNKNQKLNTWCGECAKCIFIFIILYPFVKEKEIIKIFGKDLFKEKKILPIVKALIGETPYKPFDCVGTKEESLIALFLSLKKIKNKKKDIPFILNYFEKDILPKYSDIEKGTKKIMNSWDYNNNLPKYFNKILKESYFSNENK